MELETEIRQFSSLLEKVILAKQVRNLMPKPDNSKFNAYYSIQRKDVGRNHLKIEIDYFSRHFDGYHTFEKFAEAFTGFYNSQVTSPLDFQPQSYQYEDDWVEAAGIMAGLDTNKHYMYFECRKDNTEAIGIIDEFVSILTHS